VVEGVLDRIAAGALPVGARLPSVRAMAAEALINPNTVAKAYRELEGKGVVEGRSGDGVFVAAGAPAVARRERQGATLRALRDAVEVALRAGHAPERLEREVSRMLRARRETT
jgi:GntR family transcriptional regulator